MVKNKPSQSQQMQGGATATPNTSAATGGPPKMNFMNFAAMAKK